jgi:hypothetical protein
MMLGVVGFPDLFDYLGKADMLWVVGLGRPSRTVPGS